MSPRRYLAPVAFAATVAAGGVAGALIGVPGVSGAQETDDSTADTEPETEHGRPGRLGWRGDGPFAGAAEALGMERSELAEALRDGKTLAEVAQEQGVEVDVVVDAIVADIVERTDRPEDEVRARVTEIVEEGGRIRPGGPGGFRHRHRGDGFTAAAEALGIDAEDLAGQLRDGKTIAEIAQEEGVDVDTVVDAMVAEARERIESFVNEGFPARPDADAGTEEDSSTD